jgi:GT2 family glycosyltransferase
MNNTDFNNPLPIENNIVVKKSEYKSLLLTLKELQIRIHEIETSKFWKIKLLFNKIKSLGRANANSTKWLEQKTITVITNDEIENNLKLHPFETWMVQNTPRISDLEDYKENISFFPYTPLISIIVPIFNPPISYLQKMISSVQEQVYTNWELCLADDNSIFPEIKEELIRFAALDNRIKAVFREQNEGISACSNSALSIATGEYIALLNQNDLLTPEALYEMVRCLNKNKEADFIYSDEDKIDEFGALSDPYFKPDWSPENFLSRNYISRFSISRSTLIDQIGGFREGFDGNHDYDLYLRLLEITNKIYHIPKILYHSRINPSLSIHRSSLGQCNETGCKALSEALIRRGEIDAEVISIGHPGYYSIKLKVREEKLVSIIISTKDKADILETCLKSIYSKSTYKNFEIILINNNSTEEKLENLICEYSTKHPNNFFCYKYDVPFNYSLLMNYGVTKSKGDFLLFLNNDTEVISPDWIEEMMQQAQRNEIGAVGAKLYYPTINTIQHAGIIIGPQNTVVHCFVGLGKNDVGYFNYPECLNNFSAVTAACMMCRRDVFNQINGFDEVYKIEFNDIDLCLKMIEAGYRNVYVPNAQLYHHESISRGHSRATKESALINDYEKELFKNKWNKYLLKDPSYNKNLSLIEPYFSIRMDK